MSFVAPTYPAIVRDLLTTLTGGTVREVQTFNGDRLVLLNRRPVTRVSHVQARWIEEDGTDGRRTFTERDVELIAAPETPEAYLGFRFRDGREPPPDGSTLEINYYPTDTRPVPLTDVQVGSVVRTLLETVGREIAGQYVQLERVYRSAFLETAEGRNLDAVVAIADVRRRRSGHPIGRVRMSRDTVGPSTIFVPQGTVVTDGDLGRYRTAQLAMIRPNERSVLVAVEGESRATPLVEAGQLRVLERPISGIDDVTNDESTYATTAAETDDQLRLRTRRAFHQPGRGTRAALEFGLGSLPFVRSVTVDEMRNGPGTVTIAAVLDPDDAEHQRRLRREVERLRPAGVHVSYAGAAPLALAFDVALTLDGSGLPVSEEIEIQETVEGLLRRRTSEVAPGGTFRIRPLISEILGDDRIVDADVSATGPSGDAGLTISLDPDTPAVVTSVMFAAFQYERAATGAQEVRVRVTAELAVRLVTGDLASLETSLRATLEAFLGGRTAGPLSFEDVAAAIRDDDRFALYRDDSQLSLEDDAGLFAVLADHTQPYSVQDRTRLVLADLVLNDVGA